MRTGLQVPRAIPRRSVVTGGAVALFAGAVGGHWWFRGRAQSPPHQVVEGHASVGAPAPRFRLEELRDGETVSLPRKAEPLLVAFSATWCLTCVAELRNFQALHHRLQGKARIVVVNFQQSRSIILSLVERLDVPDVFILLDSTGEVTRSFGVNALPAMALIDGDGVLRAMGHEYLSIDAVTERLAQIGVTVT